MESSRKLSKDAAFEALHDVENARERLSEQVMAPWWYSLGAIPKLTFLYTGLFFIMGGETTAPHYGLGVAFAVVGGFLSPNIFSYNRKSRTGVGRYTPRWDAKRWLILTAILAVTAILYFQAQQPWIVAIGGLISCAIAVVMEHQIDAAHWRRADGSTQDDGSTRSSGSSSLPHPTEGA